MPIAIQSFCAIMSLMGTRAKKPPDFVVPTSQVDAVDKWEKKVGLCLHALVRRLPLPTREELKTIEESLKHGWEGELGFLGQPGSHGTTIHKRLASGGLLHGLGQIQVWVVKLQRPLEDIPEPRIREYSEPAEALQAVLERHVRDRPGWKPGRKARAVVTLLPEVHKHFLFLRNAVGLGPDAAYPQVINRLCKLGMGTLCEARAEMTNAETREAFVTMLYTGGIGKVRRRTDPYDLTRPVRGGPRSRECKITALDVAEFYEETRATLAIVEHSHSEFVFDLDLRLAPGGSVAYLCALSDLNRAGFLKDVGERINRRQFSKSGEDPPFQLAGACVVLREVQHDPEGSLLSIWRAALLFEADGACRLRENGQFTFSVEPDKLGDPEFMRKIFRPIAGSKNSPLQLLDARLEREAGGGSENETQQLKWKVAFTTSRLPPTDLKSLNHPEEVAFSKPFDVRKARTLAYSQLMRLCFTPENRNVFAPLFCRGERSNDTDAIDDLHSAGSQMKGSVVVLHVGPREEGSQYAPGKRFAPIGPPFHAADRET